MKKTYYAPTIQTENVTIGVFGCYGNTSNGGNQGGNGGTYYGRGRRRKKGAWWNFF